MCCDAGVYCLIAIGNVINVYVDGAMSLIVVIIVIDVVIDAEVMVDDVDGAIVIG